MREAHFFMLVFTCTLSRMAAAAARIECNFIHIYEGDTYLPTEDDESILYSCYKLKRAGFILPLVVNKSQSLPLYIPRFEQSDSSNWLRLYPKSGLEGSGKFIRSSLCYVKYNDDIIACCDVVQTDSGFPDVGHLNIFSVVSHPYYRRTGAVKLMFYNIYKYSSITIHNKTTRDVIIALEVAKDSFPVITFYDRFLLYVKLGFSPENGLLNMFYSNDRKNYFIENFDAKKMGLGPNPMDFSTITFDNAGYRLRNVPDLLSNLDSYNMISRIESRVFRFQDIKNVIPILYPTETDIIMNHHTAYDSLPRIEEEISKLLRHMAQNIKTIDASEANIPSIQRGIIGHTAFVFNDHTKMGFRTARLPDNVELILFTTPGSLMYPKSLNGFVTFYQKYMRNKPIELLEQAFPQFNTIELNGANIIPSTNLNNGINYISATSGSVIITDSYNQHIQVHCYKPGDFYPDLELYVETGKKADLISQFTGFYDINNRDNWETKGATRLLERYPPDALSKANMKLEKHRYKISDLIADYSGRSPDKIRFGLFSCGATDDNEINKTLKKASNYKLSARISASSDSELHIKLDEIGIGLNAMFGAEVAEAAEAAEAAELEVPTLGPAGGAGAALLPNGTRRTWTYVPGGPAPMNHTDGGGRRRKTFKRCRGTKAPKRRRTRYYSSRHGRSSRISRK